MTLNVSDLLKSKSFYQKLGFEIVGDAEEQSWLTMRNGDTTVDLFQGMFDSNIMTYNTGWNTQNQPLSQYVDIRVFQDKLKSTDVSLTMEGNSNSSGTASIMLTDPDGNIILIDQHM